ncbi:MAG TPA: oligosaccharide flippase family protein [Patescibacteria group bacterium]|nr:oligosaccharide flippase family protein [Patescibacteria group bacterium]
MEDIHPEEHFDPTSEITLETVKDRMVKGVVTLTSQYFVLYLITFLTTGALTIFLSPAEFGIFGILSTVKLIMSYFSDIGLAASLIQKKENLTTKDLQTAFTVQQGLVILLLIILFLITPVIKNTYHLGQDGIYLMYALGISLFFSSLKTIPSVLLERHLKFERLAFVNIIENLIYNLILVFLAWKGLGITSYTVSFLASGIVGVILIYFMQPWKIGISFSLPTLKHLLKFGIPYQANTFIALLKDQAPILLLGKIVGLEGVGYLTWAQGWAQAPLRIVMDNVQRVSFPAFARMQDDKSELSKTLTRTIFFITFLVMPAVLGMIILAPQLIHVVPKWVKWTPAIIPLIFFGFNSIVASFTTQITNVFNAIGKIKITSYLMIMWTVLTLIFVPLLATKFGIDGAAFAYCIVEVSSIIAIYLAKKYVNFSLNESVLKPLYASAGMAILLLILRSIFTPSFYSIGLMVIVGGLFYFVLLLFLVGKSLIEDAKKSFNTLFNR